MIDVPSRVFIVDDDAAMRESLCAMLRQRHYAAIDCASARHFLETHAAQRSGCVITDLRMPGMSGLELQEELLRRGSLLPVIVISGFANIPSTVRLVGNGALTVLEKPFHHDDLFEAVDRALKRNADAVSRANFRDAIACRLAKLTEEERRVMELVVAGMPHKLIARKLGLAQRTVDRRRSSMYAKLSVESAAELATLLAEYSLGARLNDQPVPGVEARGAPCL